MLPYARRHTKTISLTKVAFSDHGAALNSYPYVSSDLNIMPRTTATGDPFPTHGDPLARPIYRPVTYLKRAGDAAWYPIQGIWYFLRNPEFWPLFSGRILPLTLISFLMYFILFTFAFLPQYAFLAIFHGWGAWFNAVVLVLGEGLVIIQGLFEGFFVDECRVDVFDVGSSLKCLVYTASLTVS